MHYPRNHCLSASDQTAYALSRAHALLPLFLLFSLALSCLCHPILARHLHAGVAAGEASRHRGTIQLQLPSAQSSACLLCALQGAKDTGLASFYLVTFVPRIVCARKFTAAVKQRHRPFACVIFYNNRGTCAGGEWWGAAGVGPCCALHQPEGDCTLQVEGGIVFLRGFVCMRICACIM